MTPPPQEPNPPPRLKGAWGGEGARVPPAHRAHGVLRESWVVCYATERGPRSWNCAYLTTRGCLGLCKVLQRAADLRAMEDGRSRSAIQSSRHLELKTASKAAVLCGCGRVAGGGWSGTGESDVWSCWGWARATVLSCYPSVKARRGLNF